MTHAEKMVDYHDRKRKLTRKPDVYEFHSKRLDYWRTK